MDCSDLSRRFGCELSLVNPLSDHPLSLFDSIHVLGNLKSLGRRDESDDTVLSQLAEARVKQSSEHVGYKSSNHESESTCSDSTVLVGSRSSLGPYAREHTGSQSHSEADYYEQASENELENTSGRR